MSKSRTGVGDAPVIEPESAPPSEVGTTAAATPEPTPEPTPAPTPAPGLAPGPEPAPEPAPAPAPESAPAPASEPAPQRRVARRGAVDPVKALIHRHRELCERAVDPLEIAAGLEAHGVTDRTAARYRHRDVFSLAEEMYARVPRDERPAAVRAAPEAGPALGRPPRAHALLALLPPAVGAATVAAYQLTHGRDRLIALAVGVLALAVALRIALRRGPLRARSGAVPGTRAWSLFLLLYALVGDGFLRAALAGGPDAPWPLDTAALLGLALAYAPAVWCARIFAVGAQRRLGQSRGLEEFAAGARPLLLAVVALQAGAAFGLLVLAGRLLGRAEPPYGAALLAVLLLLARMLTSYGFRVVPGVVLGGVCLLEGFAVAAVLGARLPGCWWLALPVETVGAGAVPVLACGAGTLVLLVAATRRLTRASAHAPTAPGAHR
ncbi:hypothetical protein [Streptomyces cavernicola]|uniref:Integral membrane protein n=1 Tax=Streptomyces cavernicola TaxID=3043613 RepID=A0ABT6SHS5_9ACTN|nr:hypothetical protein [Streptomyces sp. B-S-A6]MDI3407750.1 hypothetical protein [Streptomyces sp. B-S-A6]